MDIQSYRDKDDFLVEIGTVVAYEEAFLLPTMRPKRT